MYKLFRGAGNTERKGGLIFEYIINLDSMPTRSTIVRFMMAMSDSSIPRREDASCSSRRSGPLVSRLPTVPGVRVRRPG